MRYSLLNQFRGAFLGAVLGSVLGTHCAKRAIGQASLIWTEVEHWGFQSIDADEVASGWGKVAIRLMADLIHDNPWHDNPWTIDRPLAKDTLAGLAVATLPLSLYYHEDLQQQEQALQGAIAHSQLDITHPALTSAISTIGFTLSLTLQNKLVPALLISQLVSGLALEEHHPFLSKQLFQVQHLTTSGTGLSIALSTLTASTRSTHSIETASLAIALALYAFLTTPADFRLSLIRAAQMGYQPHVTCALVGALSGAYNSVSGLPLAWQMSLERSNALSVWGISTLQELILLVDQLWSSWSGAYHPPHLAQKSIQQAIAAPHVIRPRT